MKKQLLKITLSGSYDDFLKTTIHHGFLQAEVPLNSNYSNSIQELGQTLYLTPGCSVPRHKIKELNFNTTIKAEKGNEIIIPSGDMKSCDHYDVHRFIPVAPLYFRQFLNDIHIGYHYSADDHKRDLLQARAIAEGVDVDDTIFGIDFNTYKKYWWHSSIADNEIYTRIRDTTNNTSFNNNAIGKDFSMYNAKQWARIENKFRSNLQFISPKNDKVFGSNKTIYFDKDLLNIANKNKLIINEENFNDLKAYGDADDDENLILLMELMANSDFETNLPYLYAYCYHFGSRMIKLKAFDHVNFKSLMVYLDFIKKDMRFLNEQIIEDKIRSKGLWTGEIAKQLALTIR